MARVVSLFVSPGIGQPMQPRTFVRALAGRGLHGDRYALGQGSYSNLPRPHGEDGEHVDGDFGNRKVDQHGRLSKRKARSRDLRPGPAA